MTTKTLGGLAAVLLLGTALGGCVPPDIGSEMVPPPPPPVLYDPGKVGDAISDAAGSTPRTTIYTNVLNGSGGSCVDAATTRGQAIADKLGTMQSNGEIPADHTIDVHTYSGYRVPGVDYGSLHTYTVTQIKGPDGKVKDTWTSDNYLGPNSTTHYTGDGGYTNWSDPLTNPVPPTNAPTPTKKPRVGGSGGGGGAGGGGGGGGGGGEG
ncbi:hypothetical protein [Dongia sp.]|uniref:hypothetical protein n=1 Tax=Dongia sp. TaxID=1977262 RepID=UPI0037536884